MNKKQYNNVIENTLKCKQFDDSLATARAIFDNMGVDYRRVILILSTEP